LGTKVAAGVSPAFAAFGGGAVLIGLGTDESKTGEVIAMVDSTSSPPSGGRSLSS
jgi:hypothetical protein